MPFSRSKRSNRRGRRSFHGGSKREVVFKRVPRLSTINNKIKKINSSVELKYVDTFFSNTFVVSPTLLLLNHLSQGTTSRLRIGSKISATSIQFRAHVSTDSETLESTRVRFIIFWDRQANQNLPTVVGSSISSQDAVLDVGTITDYILAPYMMETQERFTIVYDKVFTLNPMQGLPTSLTTEVIPVSIQFKKKIPLSRVVKYNGNGGSINDIDTNSLYCTYFSDQVTTPPNMDIGARFIFKDL